jgi:hypothetical protein
LTTVSGVESLLIRTISEELFLKPKRSDQCARAALGILLQQDVSVGDSVLPHRARQLMECRSAVSAWNQPALPVVAAMCLKL